MGLKVRLASSSRGTHARLVGVRVRLRLRDGLRLRVRVSVRAT